VNRIFSTVHVSSLSRLRFVSVRAFPFVCSFANRGIRFLICGHTTQMGSLRNRKPTSDVVRNARKPVSTLLLRCEHCDVFYIIILIRIIKLESTFLTLNVRQTESQADELAQDLKINYVTGISPCLFK
jgi:hypothetical protein